MIQSVLTVTEKVFVLFLMMGVGYLCYKKRIITSRGAAQLTNLLLYVIGPCLIIAALQTDSDGVSMNKILLTVFLFSVGMILTAVLTRIMFRDQESGRAKLLRFGMVYSNCGFMGLPLAQGLLGEVGVVYASACLVAFNLLLWTHGYITLSGGGDDRRQMIRNVLLNPGTVSFAIGLPLYALSIKLPPVLLQPLDAIGQMNTPLAMIVVGTYLAKLSVGQIFSDKDVYLVAGVRLLIVPCVFLVLMWLVRPDPAVLVTTAVLMGAPVAANAILFAAKFGHDAELACKMIALSTLLSILAMPAIAAVAQNMVGVA
ncbi:AEC family transporter [Clostridium minihomine]|uniref:AEC family transporter n=1 Tax=Clostridium minihomine TaxID=2045012 RepID=UPI000C75CE49|nr:AEC family transporter [Clostridium minihomine]